MTCARGHTETCNLLRSIRKCTARCAQCAHRHIFQCTAHSRVVISQSSNTTCISKWDKAWLKECCAVVANGTHYDTHHDTHTNSNLQPVKKYMKQCLAQALIQFYWVQSIGNQVHFCFHKYKVIDVTMIVQSYHFSHFLNLAIARLLLGGSDTIFSTSQLSSCWLLKNKMSSPQVKSEATSVALHNRTFLEGNLYGLWMLLDLIAGSGQWPSKLTVGVEMGEMGGGGGGGTGHGQYLSLCLCVQLHRGIAEYWQLEEKKVGWFPFMVSAW